MDVQSYLKRINYAGSRAVSAPVLRDLHLAHLMAVPFENLSIHAGEPIILEQAALFKKIVLRRRGGFCYELNGLFAGLLRTLGFSVSMLSAQVARGDGGFNPEFDHMALMVTLQDRWLVDVGFGDSFLVPLRLDQSGEQIHGKRVFRLDPEGNRLLLRQQDGEGDWQSRYRFDLKPRALSEFAEMCNYHQTSPDSHFTQKVVCTVATPSGRVTLSGERLIITDQVQRWEHHLSGDGEYEALLRENFGIVVPALQPPPFSGPEP